jgi:tetratricopeptide (TPR) repeat protein
LYSLKAKKNDTLKANTYYAISQEYKQVNLEKFIYYSDQLKEVSEKSNYQRGLGLYYYNLTFINETLGKDRIEAAQKAASIFFAIHDIKYYLLLQYHLAFAHMSKSDYTKAKNILNISLEIAQGSPYTDETANLYELLGFISYYEDLPNTSLAYYKKALTLYNVDTSNPKKKSQLFLYIAFSHTDLENYEEALYYLDLANNTGDNIDVNIEKAVVLNKMGRYKEAEKILLSNRSKSLYKPKHIDDYNTYILGNTYFNQKAYTTAIQTLEEVTVDHNFTEFNIQYYNLLSKCYFNIGFLKQANIYNEKALNLLDASNISHLKQSVYLTKSEIEQAMENYKVALAYYEKAQEIKETQLEKSNGNRIRELQMEFDVIEKNNKIQTLQVEKLQKEIKITTQRDYIIFISIALLIASFSTFFFFKINKTYKKKIE